MDRGDLLRAANGSFVADGQLMAALRTAARQHGPPVRGLHAHPKAVGLRPVAVVRLKRTFWHLIPSSICVGGS